MVKVTFRELTPDDPIFHGGAQIFVPAPRPLNPNTEESDNQTNQLSEQESKEAEQTSHEIPTGDN